MASFGMEDQEGNGWRIIELARAYARGLITAREFAEEAMLTTLAPLPTIDDSHLWMAGEAGPQPLSGRGR